MIASGGVGGEIFIWDINSLQNAFAPGKTPSRNNDIDAIAWNNGVAHILASGSSEGTSIWDLRNRREILHLNYQSPGISSRNPVSSVAWHPDNSTTLITASSDEAAPVILLWDLRNANAPLKTIKGHEKGVLSIDWCKADSSLLLSSGKDSKTLLWDTESGNKLGEYPITSNWNFQTSFSPTYPEIFASASFDGKINIQTIQDVNSEKPAQKKADGDDFWNSNNYIDAQHPTVSLEKAPKWLKRPVSATFGFGGKIVSIKKTADGQSIVTISKFSGDESLTSDTSKLAAALESNTIPEIIQEHLTAEGTADHFDWTILDLLAKKDKALLKKYVEGEEVTEEKEEEPKTEGTDDGLFGKGTVTEDDFLSTLSLSKYEPSGTFHIFQSEYSKTDKAITKAILSGDLEKAVDIALKEDRLADAFAIAARSSEATRIKVQTSYISKNAEAKPYLRLLHSIASKDLTDIVENSNVSEWKETLGAIFSNTSDGATFKKLTSTLGDRLLQARDGASGKEAADLRNSAVLCYLIAESLPQISKIWIKEIFDAENALLQEDSSTLTPYAAHVKALHAFIEKVTIFRKTCPGADSAGSQGEGLDNLYDTYRDYANIVATQGQLSLAETYLNLLPAQYPGASLERERVSKANNKPAAAAAGSAFAKSQSRATGASSGYGYTPAKPAAPATSSNPFGAPDAASAAYPFGPARTLSPYQSGSATAVAPGQGSIGSAFVPTHSHSQSGIYAPSNPIIAPYQPPQHNSYAPANYGGIGQPPVQASSLPPPPTSTQVKKPAEGWNDLPSSAIPPPRKITTPAIPAGPSASFGAAPINPYGAPAPPQKPAPAPLGPPPTSGGFNPINNGGVPLTSGRSFSQSSSTPPPPPVANDKYAPVKTSDGSKPFGYSEPAAVSSPPASNPYSSPPVNPYATLSTHHAPVNRPVAAPLPPPSSVIGGNSAAGGIPPPQNAYAPAPGAAALGPPGVGGAYGQPQAPPPNPYGAPVAPQQQRPNPYAAVAPPQAQPYQPGQPQQQQQQYGPYSGAPQQQQLQGPPAVQQSEPEPEPEPVEPPKPKYPAGDRSHIPENAMAIFNLFSEELELIKPHIPQNFGRQLVDAEKRINILFDHLNNDDLLSDATKTDLVALAQALHAQDYNTASEIHLAILTTRSEECGHWMVGVKRLIDIVRVLVMNGVLN